MLLINMTSKELAYEYRSDLAEIDMDNKRFDNSAYVSQVLRRHKKSDTVGFERFFQSKRQNKYLNVITYFKQKNSTNKKTNWKWSVFTIGLIDTFKGVCGVMFYDNARIAVVYQAHFFMRYKERFIKECDWATRKKLQLAHNVTDIIPIYIRRNSSMALMSTKSKFGDKRHIFAPVEDGVALFQFDGKRLQANTFITKRMYSDDQQDMIDDAEQFQKYLESSQNIVNEFIKAINEDSNNQYKLHISKTN